MISEDLDDGYALSTCSRVCDSTSGVDVYEVVSRPTLVGDEVMSFGRGGSIAVVQASPMSGDSPVKMMPMKSSLVACYNPKADSLVVDSGQLDGSEECLRELADHIGKASSDPDGGFG